MTEVTKKKGMSKGCLIALIVAVILVIVVVIGGWLIYKNKDDIIKYGVVTSINSAKTELSNMEEPVIDTVVFFGVSDAFLTKFNADTLDLGAGEGQDLFLAIRSYTEKKELDSALAVQILDGMITLYPDLAEMLPPVPQEYIDSIFTDSM